MLNLSGVRASGGGATTTETACCTPTSSLISPPMASINWTIVSSSNTPVPLPGERLALTVQSTSLALFPARASEPPSQSPSKDANVISANGTVFVTNQRVVFVADPPKTIERDESRLMTLSVPFTHYVEGVFRQPWFGANYYEAIALPARGGGMTTPHVAKLTFRERGAYDFYEQVEARKASIGQARTRDSEMEPLPLYEAGLTTSTTSDGSSGAGRPSQVEAPPDYVP